MKEAIEKILKNFVFVDDVMPRIVIETKQTMDKDKLLYIVTAFITRKNDAHKSEELRREIMSNMETALSMLGFTNVHGQIFDMKGNYEIRALGHYR